MQGAAKSLQYSTVPEPAVIRRKFAYVALFCRRCKKMRFAPWAPARCPGCGKLLTVAE